MSSRYAICLATLTLLLAILISGCSGGGNNGAGFGVIASMNVNFHTGTVVQSMPDTSGTIAANTSIPPYNGILCEAGGPNLGQPTPPITVALLGSTFINYDVGQSQNPGQCTFDPLFFPATYDVNFISPLCGTNHHNPAAQAASSTGIIPPDTCDANNTTVAPLSSRYSASNAPPASITITANGVSTNQGLPQLNVYDTHFGWVNSVSATAVNGPSATFPFPTTTSGAALSSGIYGMTVSNANGPIVGASFYTVGGVTSFNSPFGVDAVDVVVQTSNCVTLRYVTHCYNTTNTTPYALVTLYNTNQLSYKSALINVGSRPVAVKAFRRVGVDTSDPNSDTMTIITTEPTLALVVNSGSSSVSIADLLQNTVTATVPVGSQPVALAMKSDESFAYIANYGSSSITEINLSTFTASRSLALPQAPLSLTMDPSGTALWVGGQGFLSKVDLASFSITTNLQVSGSVNSLAASVQQNQIVYSLIGNTDTNFTFASPYTTLSAPTSTYSVQQLNTSTTTTSAAYDSGASASAYSSYTMGGTLPNAVITPGGSAVSQKWGNGMGITVSPTGFVVFDLVNQVEVMRGTTPTPIRAVASDPNNWNVYMTVPDSNTLITVPLPH